MKRRWEGDDDWRAPRSKRFRTDLKRPREASPAVRTAEKRRRIERESRKRAREIEPELDVYCIPKRARYAEPSVAGAGGGFAVGAGAFDELAERLVAYQRYSVINADLNLMHLESQQMRALLSTTLVY